MQKKQRLKKSNNAATLFDSVNFAATKFTK